METKKIIAIHQPNFMPWLGTFDKILKCDEFVFLDHVKLNPVQTPVKRVKMMSSGKAQWMGIPLKQNYVDGFPEINIMEIDDKQDFSKKILRTIEQNYRKTEFFREIFPFVEAYFMSEEKYIAERNIHFILQICKQLNIHTHCSRSSALNTELTKNEMLIYITKELSGSAYMPGGGADGYQQDELFTQAGIQLIFQNFNHPTYPQNGTTEFIPGLSVIDPLMNVGIEGVKKLLAIKN